MSKMHHLLGCLGSGVFIAAATPVLAQPTQPAAPEQANVLQEIVVTAQKRAERIQDVPIVVNAITGEDLRQSGVDGLEDIKQLSPSFNYRPSIAGNLVQIRGVGGRVSGPSNESAVAVNFDGVYVGSEAGYFYPFFAVQRVEVLSGPQGTLFGRNTTGGVVNIVVREPSQEFSGQARLGYGNYDTASGELYVTGGLTDTLAADFALSFSRQGQGYGVNLFNGRDVSKSDTSAFRGSLAWQPLEGTRFRLSLDKNMFEGSAFGSHALYGRANNTVIVAGGPHDVNTNLHPRADIEGYGATLHANHDLGFAELVSITGYRNVRKSSDTDIDGGPNQNFFVTNAERNRQFSQELRLDSQGEGPLKWTAGLFYYDYKGGVYPSRVAFTTPFGGSVLQSNFNTLTTEAYAAFAQGTYALLPTTNLTLGARYSWETRTIAGVNQATVPATVYPKREISFDEPTYRISLDHHFTPDIMAYASFNRGFKSGGFNALSTAAAAAFDPERVDAYEVGVKTELFDNRLRLNASAYYYDYSNLQVQIIEVTGPVVRNAAQAKMKGFEAQLSANLFEGFSVDAGLAYTDATFDSYKGASCVRFNPAAPPATSPSSAVCDAAGRNLLNTPEWSFSVTPKYAFELGPLEVTATLSYYYASSQDLLFTDSSLLTPPERHNVNASVDIGLPGGQHSITLWANNLTDEVSLSQLNIPPVTPFSGVGFSAQYLPPRTYGIRFNTKF